MPAALALACIPGASISLDSGSYEYRAGDVVGVSGQGFDPNAPVDLTARDPSGAVAPVGGGGITTTDTGSFSIYFTLPSNVLPGDHLLKAVTTVTDAQGVRSTHIARVNFTVLPPPALAQAPMTTPAPSAAPLPAPAVRTNFIHGTDDDDELVGTPFGDVITCGAGNDRVRAGEGHDIINCGSGNDRVDGGPGADRVVGGGGNDRLAGGQGNDKLSGGKGNDVLRGNGGVDRLSGGAGRDRLFRDGKDMLSGGSGRDSMVR